MIVARGMGRGGLGALVAFGLGGDIQQNVPPVAPPETGGGTGGRRRLRRAGLELPGRLAQAREEDDLLLSIVASLVTKGILGWPGR